MPISRAVHDYFSWPFVWIDAILLEYCLGMMSIIFADRKNREKCILDQFSRKSWGSPVHFFNLFLWERTILPFFFIFTEFGPVISIT